MDEILGWDIGGAHLKAALVSSDGRPDKVVQLACPLWQGIDRLAAAADRVLAELPPRAIRHAVTMTGEMADLFPDRAGGVLAIVAFLKDRLTARPTDSLHIFAGEAGFLMPPAVPGHTDAIASANWLATAQRCAATLGDGILADIGSTTTDLIPFGGSQVAAAGAGDRERLADGSLVYLGLVRTPLMALAQAAPFDGGWRGIMNEHFATTADVFRVLGELDEADDAHPAADGGAKTVDGSARRLLRMVGEDLPASGIGAVIDLARWYRQRLLDRIAGGMALRLSKAHLPGEAPLVGAGIGRALAAELAARLRRPYRPIDEILCPGERDASLRRRAADCAPAVAVAQLFAERHR